MKYLIIALISLQSVVLASNVTTIHLADGEAYNFYYNVEEEVFYYLDKKQIRLSESDKFHIEDQLKLKSLDPKVHNVLSLFYYFPNDVNIAHNLKSMPRHGGYRPICDRIGHITESQYNIGEQTFIQSVLVGAPRTKCQGLCGVNCFGVFKRKAYTQECLNHDVCHRETHDLLGCFDELMKASSGFLFGKSCKQD